MTNIEMQNLRPTSREASLYAQFRQQFITHFVESESTKIFDISPRDENSFTAQVKVSTMFTGDSVIVTGPYPMLLPGTDRPIRAPGLQEREDFIAAFQDFALCNRRFQYRWIEWPVVKPSDGAVIAVRNAVWVLWDRTSNRGYSASPGYTWDSQIDSWEREDGCCGVSVPQTRWVEDHGFPGSYESKILQTEVERGDVKYALSAKLTVGPRLTVDITRDIGQELSSEERNPSCLDYLCCGFLFTSYSKRITLGGEGLAIGVDSGVLDAPYAEGAANQLWIGEAINMAYEQYGKDLPYWMPGVPVTEAQITLQTRSTP